MAGRLPGSERVARGIFISFEGIDGSGKSTQARLLAERLRATGHDVVLTREPGGSPGAEEIRNLVLNGPADRWSAETEVLLFTAARRDHLERVIRPALARDAVVISDRFADSTRVYQGMARGALRGLVDALHGLVIGTEPDLTFVIDIAPEDGLARARSRAAAAARTTGAGGGPDQTGTAEPAEQRFEEMGLALQSRLRTGFRQLAEDFPDRVRVVDGARPAETVAAEVAAIVVSGWPRLRTLAG